MSPDIGQRPSLFDPPFNSWSIRGPLGGVPVGRPHVVPSRV
jgi:hypothetical protein